MEFCNRCSCPVEDPITYADNVCPPNADRVTDRHVPLCVHCADVRRFEIVREIERARTGPAAV